MADDVLEDRVGLENVLDFEMTSGVNSYGLANLGSFRGSFWGEDGLVPGEFSLGILDLVSDMGFCVTKLDLEPPAYACDPSVYDTSPEGLDLVLTEIDDGGGGGGGGGGNDVPEPRTLALLGVAVAAMALARRRTATLIA